MKRLIVALVFLLSASACGSPDAPTPSTENISGTWIGSLNTTAGVDNVTISMAQNSSALSGTWSSIYPSAPINNNSGQLTGSKSGTNIALTLTASNPTSCPFTFNGTLNGLSSISGTFASFNCTVSLSGTLTLTKQ